MFVGEDQEIWPDLLKCASRENWRLTFAHAGDEALVAMDEGYKKHHMWAFPKLGRLPSEYFRSHGFASFQEDGPGLDLVDEWRLEDCFLWANDYPHHEGTWPHSAEAIERTMGKLTDAQRAKILGLNAARLFGFEVPEQRQ